MDAKSFFIGMMVSYLVGLIVSTINMLTEKAIMIRRMRKETEKRDRNND